MSTPVYLLWIVFYTGLFWGVFRLLLRKSTRHRLSRIFLWLAMLLPFVLPLIRWPVTGAGSVTNIVLLPEMVVSKTRDLGSGIVKYASWLFVVYILISLCLLARTLILHINFRRLLRRSSFFTRNGVRVYTNTGIGPGSYGTAVFLPEDRGDESVMSHELAHIRQGHYYDLLAVQCLKVICWPNPFLHAVIADLKMIHEYQADEAAAGSDVNPYIFRLLDEALGTRQYSISHSFFHQPIKNRITMLQQKTTSGTGKTRWVLAAGIAGAMTIASLWVQSCSLKKDAATEVKAASSVDQKPDFKGDLYQWLASHINYPEAAKQQQQEGRVVVRFTVDEDGSIKEARVETTSGIEALDQEALRVVQQMPEWKPGVDKGKIVAVSYALPVTFKLS